MRQPDIEIYLREDHVKDLLAWIPEALGPLVLEEAKGNTRQGVIQSTPAIPLMIVRKPSIPRWVMRCAAQSAAGTKAKALSIPTAG